MEERANALYPTANDADASLIVVAERDGYIRGAKEQKQIDEQHLLALQDAYETEKQLWIDKACEWLNSSLYPTVKTNFDNIVEVQSTQEFLVLFRKIMEE